MGSGMDSSITTTHMMGIVDSFFMVHEHGVSSLLVHEDVAVIYAKAGLGPKASQWRLLWLPKRALDLGIRFRTLLGSRYFVRYDVQI